MQTKEQKGIIYKFIVSFVFMSIIPLLYVGYLITNFIMPNINYDLWLVVGVGLVLFLAFVGAFSVRGILQSVITVNDQAKKVLDGEKTDEIKEHKAEGEVGELAGSLNQIINRIKSETNALELSQNELNNTNKKLLDNYVKLQEANEKLKKMDQMKSGFVANVAHELLNPLATIRETLEIVKTNLDSRIDDKQQQVLEISKRNIVRLIRLVTDILDISRIEAGKINLRVDDVHIEEILEEILTPLDILFKKKNIKLVTDIQPPNFTFGADRDKVIQAITNMLVNAAHFTPDNGKVTLSASLKAREVHVSVQDSGVGIDVSDQERIFDKFERITEHKKEGTGLGLSITKDIIVLHGGKIWVESESGKGSKFMFVIPSKSMR
ncbi:MAG: HAMP domain-containing sensor histidine kinase [Candidatus Ancaeobacter aquaticus]|nr:HAMP domain-containing sensor histidine kinase [Candidatus Ancaeobacter aquaticus]